MTTQITSQPQVYQGEYGQFTIDKDDRLEVIIYRSGLLISALSFLMETILVFVNPDLAINPLIANALFSFFALSLGVSLTKIHIYLIPLHKFLKMSWLIGIITSLFLISQTKENILSYVYNNPLTLFGVGFIFVALTGIYFKEAFCFNRLETKFLTPLVPLLLLGHLFGILSIETEKILLGIWAVLFMIFALRKIVQNIPSDIGDKSVFEYLKQNNI